MRAAGAWTGWSLACCLAVAAAHADTCRHHVVASAISPDGAWRAVVDEAICEAGPMASAIVDTVRVGATRRGSRLTDVLGVDTGGHVEARPRPHWIGDTSLRITLPNRSLLKVLTHRVGEVTIDVRFAPADPAGRAAWSRSPGLPPDR